MKKMIISGCLLLYFSVWALEAGTAKTDRVTEIGDSEYVGCLQLSQTRFRNELADTPKKMARGLMFRQNMAADESMLFVFPLPRQASFWMKNTLIPLDMLFFDEHRILREIKSNILPCLTAECPIYTSRDKDIAFVLEVVSGTAKRLGVKRGEKFDACQ